jgi:hypothetical protein
MNNYTVIWRDEGDDFMITYVTTSKHPADMTPLEWVLEAADVEYAEWSEQEQIESKAELLNGYDLLDVLPGHVESVL